MFTKPKNTLIKQRNVLRIYFMWLFHENTTNQPIVDYVHLFVDKDPEMTGAIDHLENFGIIKFKR